MSAPVIPYHNTDFVYDGHSSKRPNWPPVVSSHSSNGHEFVLTEDTPLNKRHFIYQPCCPNPLLKNLKYVNSEYPYEAAGFNTMDRSDMLAMAKNSNDIVSVPEKCGWRSARADVCLKEGMAYWEIEVLEGGHPSGDFSDADGERKQSQYILNTTPHVRLGICRRESSLETPIGCDAYGYSIRDNMMESIHDSKLTQVLPSTKLKPGQRIGLLLKLPSFEEQYKQAMEYTHREIDALNTGGGSDILKKRAKSTNIEFQKTLLRNHDPKDIIRDQIAIRYKNQLFFESIDYVKKTKPEYHTSQKDPKEEYTLKGSFLKVYADGQELGNAFEELYPFLPPFSELNYNEKLYMNHWKNYMDSMPKAVNHRIAFLKNKFTNNGKLGYYPAISCFNGGVARIITTKPDLLYWDNVVNQFQEDKIFTLDELYKQQVADDIVWDLIAEIEAEEIRESIIAKRS
ncbi:HBL212Cp [Eremothecium sinecaudum]|uniref:HBL212Cp n=1 Tax=Eremothecium sinecaudum TaxID=45286 RepID=A0A120K0U3_9SACH|nr:HBL212Cp [Eremothecium sinecaudum]AMD18690.1 HBL212Cp [Eremothecium sinecaudum]